LIITSIGMLAIEKVVRSSMPVGFFRNVSCCQLSLHLECQQTQLENVDIEHYSCHAAILFK
jgi:hypothetical protein